VKRVRILLADDHQEMRETVKRLLQSEFEIVGVVASDWELLQVEAETETDVCVIDISMPSISGIDAAQRLRAKGSQARVIFLTLHEDPAFVQAALEAGASGYVLKSRIISDLSFAIREAVSGRRFISPSRKLGSASDYSGLNDSLIVVAVWYLLWLAPQMTV
jgi:DNA-binding NarL/FixJ family response regulator